MKRKRILFLNLGGSMGGVESYLEGLASMLNEHADLYCLCMLPELTSRLRALNVRVFKLPLVPSWARIFTFAFSLVLLPVLTVWHRIDIVQVNGLLESIFLLPVRLLGREAVYTRHGPFEDDRYKWYKQPARYYPRLLSRICVRFATLVICVSESVGVVVRGIVPAEKTVVIPNWVSKVPPGPRQLPQEGGPVQLLYVGRLERYKGLFLLLEAMRTIPNIQLTVLGDGPYRQELEKMAQGLQVSFRGFQRSPETFYDEADIFVMPSLGPEGLPMVTLEAMAQGLPCIFSDLTVHAEITENGKAAMLFSCGDVGDLAEKLKALVERPDLREVYSRAAYHRVLANYTPEVAREAYRVAFGIS